MRAHVRWHARWVLPIAGPPIADGTVITEGSRITWVGPRATAPRAGREEELGDAILTPGLVNAHTHLDLTVLRGLLGAMPFFDWVRTVTRARNELRTEEMLDAAMFGIAEGLAAGITTFGDTAPGDESFRALVAMRVRGIAFREVFGPDPALEAASMSAFREQVSLMRPLATDLVRVGVSPHAPYSVSDALFRAVAAFAAEQHLPIAIHIAESAEESALVARGEGPFAGFLRGRGIAVAPRAGDPIALLAQNGLLRSGTLLIHCVHADAAAVQGIAAAGCGVAHCPASNAKLMHDAAPLIELLAAGARVGLGSDSMASNDRMDLLDEARRASLVQQARTGRPDALSARAALRLATLGGAEALRLDADVGSLEVGKQADLAAFSLPPLARNADPTDALIFGARPLVARTVVVAGEERVRDGIVLGLDAAVAQRVQTTHARLLKWRSTLPGG